MAKLYWAAYSAARSKRGFPAAESANGFPALHLRVGEVADECVQKNGNQKRVDYNKDSSHPQVKLEKCGGTGFSLRSVSIAKSKPTTSGIVDWFSFSLQRSDMSIEHRCSKASRSTGAQCQGTNSAIHIPLRPTNRDSKLERVNFRGHLLSAQSEG